MKYAFLLALGLVARLAPAQQTQTRADSLLALAQAAGKAQNYPQAIAAYQRVAQKPTARPRYKALSLYNIACYYSLQHDASSAYQYLGRAIAAGHANADQIAADTDLNLLHPDKRWPRLLTQARQQQARQVLRRPQDVPLVTADLDHFWAAYAAARQDTAHAPAIFRRLYFGPGSEGLQDYYRLKIESDADFAKRVLQRPQYYGSIRGTTLALADQKPRIVGAFRRFQELYPAVRFYPIYFVVGGWVSGGTVSDAGLLIGADQVANGPGVNTSELTLVQRNRCAPVTQMPGLMVHELVHRNQGPQDGTLLSYALSEGMADFVAELVTGSLGNNGRLHTYGNAHERELWQAFRQEMLGTDAHNWIANGKQETPTKPCDLGYYVGYRIVQAYYSKAADKPQALAHILTMHDPKAFLVESGYEADVAQR